MTGENDVAEGLIVDVPGSVWERQAFNILWQGQACQMLALSACDFITMQAALAFAGDCQTALCPTWLGQSDMGSRINIVLPMEIQVDWWLNNNKAHSF